MCSIWCIQRDSPIDNTFLSHTKLTKFTFKFDSAKVDDEFLKLWRSVTVDAMDDAKIDEYLEKQGEYHAENKYTFYHTTITSHGN